MRLIGGPDRGHLSCQLPNPDQGTGGFLVGSDLLGPSEHSVPAVGQSLIHLGSRGAAFRLLPLKGPANLLVTGYGDMSPVSASVNLVDWLSVFIGFKAAEYQCLLSTGACLRAEKGRKTRSPPE